MSIRLKDNPYVPKLNLDGIRATGPRTKEIAPSGRKTREMEETNYSLQEMFDDFVEGLESTSMNRALETASMKYLKANKTVLWLLDKENEQFYSPTFLKICAFENSILGKSYESKEIINITNRDSFTLLIPLGRNDMRCILQASRLPSIQPFSESEIRQAKQLQKKFRHYASYLLNHETFDETYANICSIPDIETLTYNISEIAHFARCDSVDIFIKVSNFYKRLATNGAFLIIQKAGISTHVLDHLTDLILDDVTTHPMYDPDIDGTNLNSVFAHPLLMKGRNGCIVFRRQDKFTHKDIRRILAICPIIGTCVERNYGHLSISAMNNRLSALLDIAESIGPMTDLRTLITMIMERACSLIGTERCSLFMVDRVKNEIYSTFNQGLDSEIRIPMSRGIVGYTARTGQIVNITNAYNDPRFDNSVDIETGFRTRNILGVPIYNSNGEVTGVTQMINKKDGNFIEDDIKIMKCFNVFCGISLDNVKLFNVSTNLANHLKKFVEAADTFTKSENKNALVELLESAADICQASRATMLSYDVDTKEFQVLANYGHNFDGSYERAQEVVEYATPQVFGERQPGKIKLHISGYFDNNTSNGPDETLLNAASRLSQAFEAEAIKSPPPEIVEEHNEKPQIFGFPLTSQDRVVIGIVEFETKLPLTTEHIKLLESYCTFASMAIERDQLQKIAKSSQLLIHEHQFMKNEEKDKFTTPANLVLDEESEKQVFTLGFDAQKFDGFSHYRVMWAIFTRFDLLREFNVTNEKFFSFLTEVSESYNKVPYHNRRHAVDVTQFVAYEIIIGKIDKILTKEELFCLLIACICHDINHDGFTNVYNVKAETPLGILFKNQSVMETHHCEVTIGIMTNEMSNVFACFEGQQYSKMWQMLFTLILGTDMFHHYTIIKQFNELLDKGPLDYSDDQNRLKLMQILLKCGDISNVSRPFKIADKWCDVLCEEFFRQGDLEQAQGMEYTSNLNDRAHLDKPKSQIGFYKFVCLPLFEVAERAIPELGVNKQSILINLKEWERQLDL
ncbi:3'5'-cyclic nucleotide phosphodiesterase family protein [Trichomonas vaginalis G3]|uniref:Phosphodiesterase n=1 Tax=Trichomonas vaginalis (strain ATCC PRA-98 / G3) TaxID=412133 RepID=A2DNV4_TRIV3|nr:cyclic nucleotide phosphodiesterase family [Trichomonas vaginalis G3]EAY17949.1 3'5'-cyclic nucleotide phosphodiesterase family protein [Trichomonas vaginalis G3]KAI5527131.1 cyclic nucleotide phosphodiesterase family [Trichomonas vaginalis G3]|eukprot:XP_001578935.1 3'5'-cyclic nucleotide phosphodiesterase family protein [Trichomonas vaginalis G3]